MSGKAFLWLDMHREHDGSDILSKVIEFYELESVTDDLDNDEDKEKLIIHLTLIQNLMLPLLNPIIK